MKIDLSRSSSHVSFTINIAVRSPHAYEDKTIPEPPPSVHFPEA